MPKTLLRSASRLACLAGLLLSASSYGQAVWTADSGIRIVDATVDPVNPAENLSGKGNPYGLEISVGSSVPGGSSVRSENRIQRVGVRIQNLSHSYFADLDILLAGPGSRNVVLMSDVALNQGTQGSGTGTAIPGGTSISRIQIEPTGEEFPQGISPVISATKVYKPRNLDGGDGKGQPYENFPDLPSGPYDLTLDSFKTLDPKDSKWKLYVLDDRRIDDGEMGPWQLLLWLDPYPEVEGKAPGAIHEIDEMVEDTVREFTITIADPDSADNDIHFEIIPSDTSIQSAKWYPSGVPGDKSGYSYRKDGNTWKLALKPVVNRNTENPYTVAIKVWDKRGSGTADDGDGARKPDGWNVLGKVDAASIRIKKLRAVNDAPTIGKLYRINKKSDGSFERLEVSEISTDQGRLAGNPTSSGLDANASNEGNYAIEVGDADTNTGDLANLKIEGVSSSSGLIANTDIFTDGTTGLREIRLAPSGAAPNGLSSNSGSFTIVVKDPAGESASKNITFKANTVPDRHFRANPSPISLLPAASSPTTATLNFTDISAQGRSAEIEKVTVTLADISHRNPNELAIVLRGPNNRAVTLMNDDGGSGGGSFALNKARITFEDGKPQIGSGPIVQNGIRGEVYGPKGGSGGLPPGMASGATFFNTLQEAFQGQVANGTWTLFAIDRLTGETGRIQGGFILTIWARPVIVSSDLPAVNDTVVFQEDAPERTYTITVEDTDGRVRQTLIEETDSTGTPLVGDSNKKLTLKDFSKTYLKGDEPDKDTILPDPVSHTFKIQPKADIYGRTYLKITAWDSNPISGKPTSNNFKKELLYTVDIRAVNGQPAISEILKQDVWLGQVVSGLSFAVTDLDEGVESPNVLDVDAESDNAQLLPRSNIKLVRGEVSPDGKTNYFQISLFPAAGEVGEANIRIRVTDKGQKNTIDGEIPDNDPSPNTRKFADTILRFTVKGSPSRTVSVLTSIRINDSATAPTPASPYPSLTSDVKDLAGVISSVKMNLYGVESTRPADNLIVLVKGNRGVVLMRDQGGLSTVTDVQLRFEDGKPPIPGTLTSGEWRPNDTFRGLGILNGVMPPISGQPNFWNNIEVFPTFREAFENQSPNGVWGLYVADDTTSDPANNKITSWMVTIETKPDITNIDRIEISEGKETTIEIDVGDPQPGVRFGIVLEEVSSPTEGTLVVSYTIDPTDIGDKRRIKIKTAADIPRLEKTATARMRVTVTNPQLDQDFDEFDLVALQENDAPAIDGLPEKDGFKVLAGTVSPPLDFSISDVETTIGDLAPTLRVTSGDSSVLPQANIKVAPKSGGTANQYTITILPVGSQNISAPINVEVTDKGSSATTNGSDAKTTKKSFVYTAENGDRLAFSNPGQIQIIDRDRAIPYPVVISVPASNIKGVVGRVKATLNGLVHDFPDDITIVLESPSGRRIVLMSNAGGINPDNSIKDPISLSFSSIASIDIPNTPASGAMASGTYRTKRYEPDVSLPGGIGSVAALSDDISRFLNDPIAGNWLVYVYDDSVGDQGTIRNGISLAFETAPTVQLAEGTPVSERNFFDDSSIPASSTLMAILATEDTDKFLDLTILDTDSEGKPSDINITATTIRGDNIVPTANLTWEGANNGITRRLKIKPAANLFGKVKIRLTLEDRPGGTLKFTTTYDFLVEVRSVDDTPEFTFAGLSWWTPVDKETPLYGPIVEDSDWQRIEIRVRDVDSELKPAEDFLATSSDTTILPFKPENLAWEYPATIPASIDYTTMTVLAKPAANQHGTNLQINLSMKDKSSTGRTNFYLPVLSQNDNPAFVPANYVFSNFTGNLAVKVGEIKSTPVFRVSDVETDVKDITVRLTSSRDDIIPVSQMSISANGNERILNFRAVGSGSQRGIVIGVTLVDRNTPTAGESPEKTFTVDVEGTIADNPRIFANTDTIIVPGSGSLGKSSPYPASIAVPDGSLLGDIAKVSVILDGLTHQTPDDLDVLLQGPDGTTVILMSDVGGTVDVANLRLEFDDSGTDLRDDGPLVSGKYRPANFDSGTVDSWPDVTLKGVGSSLSAFKGLRPSGTWRLFVYDDASGEIGEITKGWSLLLVTTPVITLNGNIVRSLPTQTFNEDGDPDGLPITNGIRVYDPDGGIPFDQLSVTVSSSNGDVIPPSTSNVIYDDIGRSFQVKPAAHQFANPSSDDNLPEVTYTVSRGAGGPSWSLKVKNRILPRNDDPIISRLVNAKISEGTTYRLRFQVEDNDFNPKDRLRISVTSGNSSVVENTGIRFVGTTVNVLDNVEAGTFEVDITPRPNVINSAQITVSVTDNSTLGNHSIPNGTASSPNFPPVGEPDNATDRSDSASFTLSIEARNDPPDILPVTQTISAVAGARTTFDITVKDPDHSNADITITPKSNNQDYIRDSNISVVLKTASNGSGESVWTVAFTPELNIKGPTTITLTSKDKDGATDSEVVNVTIGPSRARQFTTTEKIIITDFSTNQGRANPYPSTNLVTDLEGDVYNIRVELVGLTHGYPDDMDIILVSPKGTAVKIMSDMGGSTKLDKVNLFISDSGSAMPTLGPLVSGSTYRPGNDEADVIPGNIPAGPFLTTMADFKGQPAKGAWRLYVLDDTAQDSGELTAWTLSLETQPRIEFVKNPPDISIPEDDPIEIPFKLVDEASVAGQAYTFEFVSSSTNIVDPANLKVEAFPKYPDFRVIGRPVLEAVGSADVTIRVKGADYPNLVGEGKFKVTTSRVQDPPFITDIADQVISSGTLSVIEGFDYGDDETPKKDLGFKPVSSNPALIPDSNIFDVGNRLFIIPVGTNVGTATITMTVRDGGGLGYTNSFDVVVNPALHSQFAGSSSGNNAVPITLRDFDGVSGTTRGRANPYPSTITVPNLGKGRVSRVTVALSKLTHGYPSDLDVLLVGPNGASVMLMSDAGGGLGLTNAWFELSDAGSDLMPANPSLALVSGTYKPTNHDIGSDIFPADAPSQPAGGYPTRLNSAFAGIDPAGNWRLYIIDDVTGDSGTLADWILNIYTDQPSVGNIANVSTDENTPVTVRFRVEDANTPIESLSISVVPEDPTLVSAGRASCVGSECAVVLTPKSYRNGSTRVIVTARDETSDDSSEFMLTVNPVNYPPEILGLDDAATASNRTLEIPFAVNDPDFEDLPESLKASVEVLQPSLGSAQISGNTAARKLIFVPAGSQGGVEVRVTVSDASGAATSETINITIGPNYGLTISPISNVSVDEDSSISVAIAVLGSETGNVTVEAEPEDKKLIQPITVTGSGSAWLANIKPIRDMTGSTKVFVTARDEFGTGAAEFTVTVNPIPDAPVIAPIPDQSTTMNVAARVTLEVTDLDSDITTLVYTADFTNPSLVSNVRFGVNDENKIVATVNLVSDAVGTSSITVFADDGTSKTARSFLLQVTSPPNQPPVLAAIPDQSTTKNVPARVTLSITDPDTDIATILYSAEFSNTALVRNVRFGIDNANNVVATVNLVTDAIGTSSVTIFADDGTTKVARSFILTVTEPPNEPPVFGPIEDQITDANKPVTVVLNITDPDTALTDLKLTAAASNSRVIAGVTFNATATSVTATVNPVKDATGVSTVTITADDGKNKVSQVFAVAVNQAPEPEFAKPTLTTNADGSKTITLTWENGGELEYADSAVGPWVKTGNTSGSYSEPATSASRVYRVRR